MKRDLPNTESQEQDLRKKENPLAATKLAARLLFNYKAHRAAVQGATGWVAKHKEISGVSLVLRLQTRSKGKS